MNFYISHSIISADFTKLKEKIQKIEYFDNSFIHHDTKDGNFVPNISFGLFIVEQIRSITNLILDTHLMIKNPDYFIDKFASAGSDIITFHVEETYFTLRLLSKVKSLGKECGISLNPTTPFKSIFEVLPYIDLILVMSVEPGFSGQKFIGKSLKRIKKLNNERKKNNFNFLISVDGGVNEKHERNTQYRSRYSYYRQFLFQNVFDFVKEKIFKLKKGSFKNGRQC